MRNKNKRVLWLLNHKTLMPFEAQLLTELGYEVFTPKAIPKTPSFRSGTVDFEYDQTLTIPKHVLSKLNQFDFYETVWPTEIVSLMNRYFGTVYVIPYGVQTKEALRTFAGQIMFRAFGLDNSQTYANVLQLLYGPAILADIAALGGRFWFAQGYDQLAECEPKLIADRAIYLPIGVPDFFWKTANSYTGVDRRVLFVCPNCVTNSYYAAIYAKFKEFIGDLPHVIVGAQDVPVDDPHMLGFVSNEELVRLYQESAVLYYHSTERRHVHYSPIEAAINGMPVVYYAESLLGRMTPEITLGRCTSPEEARRCIERILAGDREYSNSLRRQQQAIPQKLSDEYCQAVWKRNLDERLFDAALRERRSAPCQLIDHAAERLRELSVNANDPCVFKVVDEIARFARDVEWSRTSSTLTATRESSINKITGWFNWHRRAG